MTNLRKRDSEFLGFRIKLRRKSNSWVITSNVCDKAIHRISKEMADSVKAIQSSKTAEEISLNVGDYNAKVIGVQDYYCIATRVNLNSAISPVQSMDSFSIVLTESRSRAKSKTDI